MRRLIAVAAVAAAAFLPTASARADSALSISPQTIPASAFAHVTGVGSMLIVRGRAPRGTVVTLTAPCALAPCQTGTVADRRGRWGAALELALPADTRAISVTVTAGARQRVITRRIGAPPPATVLAGAPRLAVIGDSLAYGIAELLPPLLGGWNVTTHARIGRFLGQGMGVLAATPLPGTPPILAFSLFTNDDPRQVDGLEAAVRAAAARIPGGCMVWATISRPKVAGVSYAAANARLHRLAADPTLGARLIVVPWRETIARSPKLLGRDRVHPTPAGYARRAALFASAAQACLATPAYQVPASD